MLYGLESNPESSLHQGSIPGVLYCRVILDRLSHQGNPPHPTPKKGWRCEKRVGKQILQGTLMGHGKDFYNEDASSLGILNREGL